MLSLMRCLLRAAWLLALVLAQPASARAAPPPSSTEIDHFEKKVRPILATHCWKCHGPQRPKGGLRFDSAAGLAKGGNSGAAVVPGRPEKSLLIQAVRHSDILKMPPKYKLKPGEIADLEAWIKAGAPWPGEAAARPTSGAGATAEQRNYWAFQPIRTPPVPAVKNAAWVRNQIDTFILSKLEAAGLQPSPPAEPSVLLRRLYFDLIGLPPTPSEAEAFHQSSIFPLRSAILQITDRLLASPHHGERWARHWLDVVRYADTTANDANAVMRYAWRYRDYVVAALNKDRPYDQFIVEQLAGDLLPPTGDIEIDRERLIATGFLMIGPKALAETDKEQSRLDIVDDQLDVTGRAFLGLTLGCARCHDHKFDPIPTLDYYALAGIFRSTEVFRDDVRNASFWHEWPLPGPRGQGAPIIMAPREGKPADLKIHLRGDHHRLGQLAPRGFLQVIADKQQPSLSRSQSGRLELARWIASPRNPLTARVIVNRIWQHHFGAGLVATPDNFGTRGDKPSHPELLDWLAACLIDSGWSMKAVHRLIVTSSTYQMSSAVSQQAQRVDPSNRLLSHMPRRRLDAESLRDAMLAVSGQLNPVIGGGEAGELLFAAGEVIDGKRDFFRPNRVQADHPHYTRSTRRSIYLPVVRNALPDVLALFDAADPNGVTAARNDTTVPSQALFLLNHPFVRGHALHFAKRLLADAGVSDADRVRSAYRLALIRTPTQAELVATWEFLDRYSARAQKQRDASAARLAAWQSFCQTLLCGNEFLYVE